MNIRICIERGEVYIYVGMYVCIHTSGLFALSAQHAEKFEACVGVETSESSVAQVNICIYKEERYVCMYMYVDLHLGTVRALCSTRKQVRGMRRR